MYTFFRALALCGMFIGFVSCKKPDKETEDLGRFKYYPGCSEEQCRTWNSGCQATCMNQPGIDAQLCIDQCHFRESECKKRCR